MASTMTRTATRATGGARRASRAVPGDPAGAVARKAMNEAGRRVLGAVVDRAVARVDDVADRLDDVADGGRASLREVLTGRPASPRSERKGGGAVARTGTAARARVGAAFSLVVYRALQLLHFLQRLALQLLEALRRLARRSRTAPPEAEAAKAEEEPQEQEEATGADEVSERRRGAAERRGPRTRRGDGPARSTAEPAEPAEPAVRRDRPRPASRAEARRRSSDRAGRGE